MRAQDPSPQVTNQETTYTRSPGGSALFAGAMLVVAGIWHGLIGFAGLVHDTLFVNVDEYLYTVDLSVWGWAHLFMGAALAAVGVAVRRGQPWARAAGIVMVGLSLLINSSSFRTTPCGRSSSSRSTSRSSSRWRRTGLARRERWRRPDVWSTDSAGRGPPRAPCRRSRSALRSRWPRGSGSAAPRRRRG